MRIRKTELSRLTTAEQNNSINHKIASPTYLVFLVFIFRYDKKRLQSRDIQKSKANKMNWPQDVYIVEQ